MKRDREPWHLYPHQQQGVSRILHGWCSATYLNQDWRPQNTRALLLHDEMGLGKTIQALEALRRMMDTERIQAFPESPQLVVAPASCLHVWQDEIVARFSDTHLARDVRVFSGAEATVGTLRDCRWYTIILVSYTTLRSGFQTCLENHLTMGSFSNAELVRLCAASGYDNFAYVEHLYNQENRGELLRLVRQHWSIDKRSGSKNVSKNSGYELVVRLHYGCVVLDEVHMIKNCQGKTCKAVAFLAARYRLALSGTPMMNHGGEMLTIIRYGLGVYAADWTLIYKEPNGTYSRGLLTSVCFGRSKSDVPEIAHLLPQRGTTEEEQLVLEWDGNAAARDLYVKIRGDSLRSAEVLRGMRRQLHEQKSEFKARRMAQSQHFWTQFQSLRKVCLHHFLLRPENTDVPVHLPYNADTSFAFPVWVQEKCTTLSLCALRAFQAPRAVRDVLCTWLCRAERFTINASPKMRVFWNILLRGKKVVAISQSRQFLERILGPWMTRNGVQHALFAGGSHAAQSAALEDFHVRDELRVLMVVKTAGAHGLNLQHAASTVVLFDPHFNEALDEQSVQRVDRIGQRERNVTIRKLYMRGSVDEAMRAMQAEKTQHTQAWLGRAAQKLSLDTVELFLSKFDTVGR